MGSCILRTLQSLSASSRKRSPGDYWTGFLHSTSALPEAYDVSFSVLEVGCEAHVGNRLLVPDYLAAYLLDAPR